MEARGAHCYTTAGHTTAILHCVHTGPEQGWAHTEAKF